MNAKLYHFDSNEEVELLNYEKDGPYYTGITVRTTSGEIVTLHRTHGWNNLDMGEYGCCRVVTDDELACYDSWCPVWLYRPAPRGYQFVSYRANRWDTSKEYALRRTA